MLIFKTNQKSKGIHCQFINYMYKNFKLVVLITLFRINLQSLLKVKKTHSIYL